MEEFSGSHWLDYERLSTRGERRLKRLRAIAQSCRDLSWPCAGNAIIPLPSLHLLHPRNPPCPACCPPRPPTGSISVHINANREGNGKRYDHWIDFAVGW